jgi:NADH-quinone oxidoreductase subunit F
MELQHRVLPAQRVASLDDYFAAGGGEALETARELKPSEAIEVLDASGLRGRGGAGFPTGRKWRTVADNHSDEIATTVVVNGAEGEPGTFKDRMILGRTPYSVIEGALIAAHAVRASRVVFALKPDREPQTNRLRTAIAEILAAGLHEGVELDLFEGPHHYLYGEETALLESLGGAPPFPRIAPPYRRGVGELEEPEHGFEAGMPSATAELAAPEHTDAAPALVDNVETIANVPGIFLNGVDWYRELGTTASPGSIVCTVTGSVDHAGVGEVAMGTTLLDVITGIGGGPRRGRRIKAVLSGVSNALITDAQLATPLTYEAMTAIGSGLGSCGFIVFDDRDDITAAIAGVSRFLAVESCGQCTPCKQDGLKISRLLDGVARSQSSPRELAQIRSCLSTVADGARCFLATQQQVVVTSMLDRFAGEVAAHVDGTTPGVEPMLSAELLAITDGEAAYDERHAQKQPDWSYDEFDSGQSPVDRRHELTE